MKAAMNVICTHPSGIVLLILSYLEKPYLSRREQYHYRVYLADCFYKRRQSCCKKVHTLFSPRHFAPLVVLHVGHRGQQAQPQSLQHNMKGRLEIISLNGVWLPLVCS